VWMPRACRDAIVRSTRSLVAPSSPWRVIDWVIETTRSYASSRSGLKFAFDAGKVERRLRLLPPLHPSEPGPVRLNVVEQGRRVDAEVAWRVMPDLLRPSLQEGHRADRVAVLRVMVRRADLDEALQEEPRFAVLLAPDALEDFVRLEEVAVVEEADPFLDRIEPVRLASDHRPSYRPAADEGFGPRLADDDLPPYRAADRERRACASIVRRTSGVYVPRSVTVLVTKRPGVISKYRFRASIRSPRPFHTSSG